MGRFKLIKNPEEMKKLFNQYKDWVEENPILIEDYVGKDADRVMRQKPRCLTMEGFENYVANIDEMPDSLVHYFANTEDAYKDFLSICSHVRREIRQNQIEGGMAGIYNPSITQRLNGLVDKKEFDGRLNVQQITGMEVK